MTISKSIFEDENVCWNTHSEIFLYFGYCGI